MAKYTGGTSVKGGYYWNPRSWKVEVIPNEGGRLPENGAAFVKVPFPALFVVVPLLGALFLMFLPFIGFALVGYAVVKRIAGGAKETAADLASTMTPGWTPGEAHLTGKPGEKPAEKTPGLEQLEKDIEAKKNQK
jgi:hypothetical protein